MAIFSQTSVSSNYVKLRWQEPYVSDALNKKLFGILPKGIYAGFVIGPGGLGIRDVLVAPGSVSGGVGTGLIGSYVSGNFDESVGFSIAVHQNVNGDQSTVWIPQPFNQFHLDATGLEGQRVFVALDVNYALNASTTARLMLVNGAQLDASPSLIVAGYVDVPVSPVTPLDATMFGYNDPTYPRLTPLSTPQKSGLMPASAWSLIGQDALPWTTLLYADRDPNNYKVVEILPSQKVVKNRRVYTYIQSSTTSRFPRNNSENYNGGVNNDQYTKINIGTGVISGAHQIASNLSIATPSIVTTPNQFQVGIVSLTVTDRINVTYGSAYSTWANAVLDANLPNVNSTEMQVVAFVASTDGSGNLNNLGILDILDRRHFLNLGGGGAGSQITERPLTGNIDGTNTIFTTTFPPLLAALDVYQSGLLLEPGVDFTYTGSTVSLTVAPQINEKILFKYSY